MGSYSIGRTVGAILLGLLIVGFIDQTLEKTTVVALADAPPTTEAAYVAVRNRPVVLIITLITHALSAMLAGYLLGRVAGSFEVRHAAATAVLATIAYIVAFMTPNVMLPPVWVRVVMLLITPPALLAGAKVRADARAIREEISTKENA